LPNLEIAYDELLRYQYQIRLIWDFLSIKPEEDIPELPVVISTKSGYRDVIRIHDDVKEVLATSKFAEMLE
jgi:hypothetical protein